MRSQCRATCMSACCTRSSARWWSPVSSQAVRSNAPLRAATNSSNAARSRSSLLLMATPFTPYDARDPPRGGHRARRILQARARSTASTSDVGVVEVEGQPQPAGPDGGADAGGGESLGHVGRARHRDDRRVAGRQAEAVAEGVGQGQVVGVDAVDADLEQQVERRGVAHPAAPGRREVEAAGVLGQPQRRPVDGVPPRAAGVPARGQRSAPRRAARGRRRRSRCRGGRAATCSRSPTT